MKEETLPPIETARKTIKKEWVKPGIEIISVESGINVGSEMITPVSAFKTHFYAS